MGMLTPDNRERELLQRFFEEKVRLIGEHGFFWEVKDHNLDKLMRWDKASYFEPIPIDFLFEEMPSPKTLKGLNWWDDDDSTTPPIAQLPWHVDENRGILLKPTIGSLLEIRDPYSGHSRFFEIQEVNANTYYMIYSVCKLSPARLDFNVKGEREEPVRKEGGSYEFLNIPEG